MSQRNLLCLLTLAAATLAGGAHAAIAPVVKSVRVDAPAQTLAWGYQQKQKQKGGGSDGSNAESAGEQTLAWGYKQKQKGGSGSDGS